MGVGREEPGVEGGGKLKQKMPTTGLKCVFEQI